MYPQGYICLSEWVHLRLAIDEKNILHIIYFQIFIHILVSVVFKNHYTVYLLLYISMNDHDKIFCLKKL